MRSAPSHRAVIFVAQGTVPPTSFRCPKRRGKQRSYIGWYRLALCVRHSLKRADGYGSPLDVRKILVETYGRVDRRPRVAAQPAKPQLDPDSRLSTRRCNESGIPPNDCGLPRRRTFNRYAQLFVTLCHRLIVMSAQRSVSGFLLSVLCVSTHSPAIPNATPSTEFRLDKKTHR